METTLLLVSGAIECLIVLFVAGRKSRKRIEALEAEVLFAVVCLHFVRNVFGYCGAVWFVTQAIDEVVNGNFWGPNSYWEYAAFSALALAAYLFHRYR